MQPIITTNMGSTTTMHFRPMANAQFWSCFHNNNKLLSVYYTLHQKAIHVNHSCYPTVHHSSFPTVIWWSIFWCVPKVHYFRCFIAFALHANAFIKRHYKKYLALVIHYVINQTLTKLPWFPSSSMFLHDSPVWQLFVPGVWSTRLLRVCTMMHI